jgi:hypothetical protein
MKRYLPLAIALALSTMASTATAATTLYKFDVTVTSPVGSAFSFPLFEIFNLSDPGVTVTKSRIFNGPPWDWINTGPGVLAITNPVGGTRTLLEGEERATDGNNGCTPGITYGFTGFDSGDSFRLAADPETGGCGSAVVDIRPFLNNDILKVTVDFSGGVSLTGNDWVLEYIDPNSNRNAATNQLYRLSMQTSVITVDPIPGGVPEPATWAMMIGGFGMAGAMLRRRRALAS